MPPELDPVVAAAPAADVSVPEVVVLPVLPVVVAEVVSVVDPAVVPEPPVGGAGEFEDAVLGAASCRRAREVFVEVVFELVLDDEVAALAGGVRVGEGVVAADPDEPEPEPEDGVATGVRRFGVVCIGVACPL